MGAALPSWLQLTLTNDCGRSSVWFGDVWLCIWFCFLFGIVLGRISVQTAD